MGEAALALTHEQEVVVLAKRLAVCRARVAHYATANSYGLPPEAQARAGALMVLAQTALKVAQCEYDHAVDSMSVEEIDAIGRVISEEPTV